MTRAWDSSPILRVPVRVPEGGTLMEVIYEQCTRYFYSPERLRFSSDWLEPKQL
jgi:hypothetical protein